MTLFDDDHPDYGSWETTEPLPFAVEALYAFPPYRLSETYARGGIVESASETEMYRDEAGKLASRPRRYSVRYTVDRQLERDRARAYSTQGDWFTFV